MKKPFSYYIAWTLCLALAIVLHLWIRHATFSLIPLPLLLSILITLLAPNSLAALVLFGLLVEITSSALPGLNMLIVLTPWLLRQLLPHITLALSFSLLGLLLLMTTVQTSLAYVPAMAAIPWSIYFTTIGLTTSVAYALILIWQEYVPMHATTQPFKRFW